VGRDEGFPEFHVFLLKAHLKYKEISSVFPNCRTSALLHPRKPSTNKKLGPLPSKAAFWAILLRWLWNGDREVINYVG